MDKIFFENIHKATGNYPYLDFAMENINYIAHFHEEIEVVYVVSGVVTITTETGTFTGHKDDICIFMPGEIHSFLSTEQNRLYIMKMHAKPQIENIDFFLMRLKNNVISENHEMHKSFQNAIQNIAKEEKEKNAGYEFAIHIYINQMIMFIARCLPHEFISIEQKKKLSSRLVLLKNVNEYVEAHYAENITLFEISKYCKFSKFYFAHYFKDITNISFIDYLMIFRLEKSLTMIKLSTDNMTNIAFTCGFNNVRSFNRMFKKHFFMTPTEYKKSLISK